MMLACQTGKNQAQDIHTFKPTTTNGNRKGSVLRQHGVEETKEYRTGLYSCQKGKNGVGLHRVDVDEHDVTCSDVNGE